MSKTTVGKNRRTKRHPRAAFAVILGLLLVHLVGCRESLSSRDMNEGRGGPRPKASGEPESSPEHHENEPATPRTVGLGTNPSWRGLPGYVHKSEVALRDEAGRLLATLGGNAKVEVIGSRHGRVEVVARLWIGEHVADAPDVLDRPVKTVLPTAHASLCDDFGLQIGKPAENTRYRFLEQRRDGRGFSSIRYFGVVLHGYASEQGIQQG